MQQVSYNRIYTWVRFLNAGLILLYTDVPRIVVDQARQSIHHPIEPPVISHGQRHSLQLPDRSAILNSTDNENRKECVIITPMALDVPRFSRPRSTHSLYNNTQPPEKEPRRARSVSVRRSPQQVNISNRLGGAGRNEGLSRRDAVEEDTFTQYYAIESAMEAMTDTDAYRIVSKLQNSTWSSKSCSLQLRILPC
jgi:hypothetical protein